MATPRELIKTENKFRNEKIENKLLKNYVLNVFIIM